MEILIVSCAVMSIFISVAALSVALYTLVEIKAFQRSTHKVEFMPMPTPEPETLASIKQKREFVEGFNPDMTEGFLV